MYQPRVIPKPIIAKGIILSGDTITGDAGSKILDNIYPPIIERVPRTERGIFSNFPLSPHDFMVGSLLLLLKIENSINLTEYAAVKPTPTRKIIIKK